VATIFPSNVRYPIAFDRSTSIVEPIRWYFNRAGHSNASYVQASCSHIDTKKQVVYGVDAHGDNIDIDYDHLVVAIGAEPATFGIPGKSLLRCDDML
jgi:NADH dehydrogenase FAD-containing subunit